MSPVDSYWVLPKRLLAGEYPGYWNDEEARARINFLLDRGVTTFFDLTEEDEGLRPYADVLTQEARRRGIDIHYHRFAIRDHTAPTSELAAEIVTILEESLAAGEVPYVHCYAGIGRTGTIVGIWMVRNQRISGAEAIDRIANLRRKVRYVSIPSPEMVDQVTLLHNWPQPE